MIAFDQPPAVVSAYLAKDCMASRFEVPVARPDRVVCVKRYASRDIRRSYTIIPEGTGSIVQSHDDRYTDVLRRLLEASVDRVDVQAENVTADAASTVE